MEQLRFVGEFSFLSPLLWDVGVPPEGFKDEELQVSGVTELKKVMSLLTASDGLSGVPQLNCQWESKCCC